MSLLTNSTQLSGDYDTFAVNNCSRPFDAIRSTKPFVIIDEPHRFSREQTVYGVIENELKPQCVIRLGATFPEVTEGKGKNKKNRKDYLNLLYDLNAYEAFRQNLIKGVAKEHLEEGDGGKWEKVKLLSAARGKEAVFEYIEDGGNKKTFSLRAGESLDLISPKMRGITVEGVGRDMVLLSNGQEKRKGEEFSPDAFSTSYQELMLSLALERHFETERENFSRTARIKTLALFFIDDIRSYRGEGEEAWLCNAFERLLKDKLEKELLRKDLPEGYKEFLEASLADIPACHAGYFAQDNSDSDEAVAKEVDDILHNKKTLLAFEDKEGRPSLRRFLFSKWTLKEGWDNPNIFTIAKLRSSGSETSKIQEVGRGLRLPVDEYGNRVTGEGFYLNYIVDFTEKDFANKLVAEINGSRPSGNTAINLSEEDFRSIARILGKSLDEVFDYLYCRKKYIRGYDKSIVRENLDAFIAEFPALGLSKYASADLNGQKIRDRNADFRQTVRVRKEKYTEIADLWRVLNKKYLLYYKEDVDEALRKDLQTLFEGTFAQEYLTSHRDEVEIVENNDATRRESGLAFEIKGHVLPYNEYLKRIETATNIPISLLHNALVSFVKAKGVTLKAGDFKEKAVGAFIGNFRTWYAGHLMGKFTYLQTTYTPLATALTNSDGSLKDEIVRGLLGTITSNDTPQPAFLFDNLVYDSELERENELSVIKSVEVFGKIPRRSISIPTIGSSSYSPDFMYVVRRENGKKELNIIVETKGKDPKDLNEDEKLKISSARIFFEEMAKREEFDVKFEAQINNQKMADLLQSLME